MEASPVVLFCLLDKGGDSRIADVLSAGESGYDADHRTDARRNE